MLLYDYQEDRPMSQTTPVVGKGVSNEALMAAESYVFEFINSGYKEDFLILDSCLLRITNEGTSQEDEQLNLEYAYFSINTESLLNLSFDEYEFNCETISFYESQLVSGGKSGRLSAHPLAGELETIDWDDGISQTSETLINSYKDNIDKSQFEGRLFDIIIDSSLYDTIFSFADADAFDDVRDFFEAANKTLAELKSKTLDLDSANEWWSDLYKLDNKNISMFSKVLELRLRLLEEQIESVESEIQTGKKFLLEGDEIFLQYNGETVQFISNNQGPCLVFELRHSPSTSPYSFSSPHKIIKTFEEQGSSKIPLKGIFADEKSDYVYLIFDIKKEDAKKLVDSTASKIGLWLNENHRAEVIDKNNYFCFFQFN